jgi:hypothetical protein
MNVQKQTAQFREVKSTGTFVREFHASKATGVFIYQNEKIRFLANRAESMSLLKQNGLRALTHQEALILIDQNPELDRQLYTERFWLADEGSELSGYYTFNEKGKLTEGKGDPKITVYVLKGSQPMMMQVMGGANEHYFIDTHNDPSWDASVVVGVKDDFAIAPKTEEKANIIGITAEQLFELRRDSIQVLSEAQNILGSISLQKTIRLIEALSAKE